MKKAYTYEEVVTLDAIINISFEISDIKDEIISYQNEIIDLKNNSLKLVKLRQKGVMINHKKVEEKLFYIRKLNKRLKELEYYLEKEKEKTYD